jgi:hypothetical protein
LPAATGHSAAEAQFLAIGDGAAVWLAEAGVAGSSRVRAKMAQAVALAKLHGAAQVRWALGHAAVHGRFADGDLAAILVHRASAAPGSAHRAGETASLQAGTAAWQGSGNERGEPDDDDHAASSRHAGPTAAAG